MPAEGKITVPIGALFTIARGEARRAKMEEYRAKTMQVAARRSAAEETSAQNRNIERMRAQTRAQLASGLAQKGVDPTLMMASGAGGSDPATATLIAQAAAQNK